MRYLLKVALLALLGLLSQVQAVTRHGMFWNKTNSQTGSDVRLKWSTIPPRYPFTIILDYRPEQQTGFYAVWWYSTADEQFHGGSEYNGSHPYPPGGSGGTSHKWELAADGNDFQSTQNVVKDVWYRQITTVEKDASNNVNVNYYWALDSGTTSSYVITHQITAGNLTACSCTATSSTYGAYGLQMGGSPWTQAPGGSVGDNEETLSGYLRNLQIYDTVLSVTDFTSEAARGNTGSNTAVTSVGGRHLWYSNVDIIPSDIADKSGNGHDPSWVNANRPVQWDTTFSTSFPGKAQLLGVGRP